MSELRVDATAVLVCTPGEATSEALLARLRDVDPGIRWHVASAPEEPLPAPVAGADAVVYAAGARGDGGRPDLEDASAWLHRVASAAIPHAVVLSSAQAFVPSERHPGLVTERQTVPGRRSHPVAGRWRDLEDLARRCLEDSSTRLTLLRPAAMPVRGGRDLFSRLLAGRVAVTLPGHDPTLQLMTPEDVAAAICRTVRSRRPGLFHLAPAGAVSLRHALRRCSVVRLPIPRLLQAAVRGALTRMGRSGPASQLDYIRYDWTVSGAAAARELGFAPSHGSYEALRRLRRTTGAAPVDDFPDEGDDPYGMDKAYIGARSRTLFRFLHDVYWRIELAGLEHVPRHGPVVLVGTHRGFFPWDGIMMLYAMVRNLGRYPRFMIHPGLLKFPFLFDFFRKLGGVLACRENADEVLARGGMLGVFPEGVRGAFRRYADAYTLDSFGSAEYVRAAWRHGATIVPFVTVGSAESMPIVGRIESRRWRRYALWPYIPVTPTLLPVPLPAKWHTRFLPALAPDSETSGAAEQASAEIRSRMQAAVDEILSRRRSVLYGNVFD